MVYFVECSPYGQTNIFLSYVSNIRVRCQAFTRFHCYPASRRGAKDCCAVPPQAVFGLLMSDTWFTRENLLLARFYEILWLSSKPVRYGCVARWDDVCSLRTKNCFLRATSETSIIELSRCDWNGSRKCAIVEKWSNSNREKFQQQTWKFILAA